MARLPKIQVTLRVHRIRPKDWNDGEYRLPEGWDVVAGEFDEDGLGLTLVLAYTETIESPVTIHTKIVGPDARNFVDATGKKLSPELETGKTSP